MGKVYRALDTQLHRPVAVKVLSSELTSDPQRKQRFLQEARAAARISHPAVAQIYYADEEDGVTFIVMELVEGKTVRELIHSKELDLLGALDIAIQAADGLTKAHQLGIVHRDIKPPNVMLTSDGHVKILDFGLAKLMDRSDQADPAGTLVSDLTQLTTTQPGMVMGTPAYMSPEQVRGLPVDYRTDIFSFGVLVYEMATGQSPFQRAMAMDTLHAVAFDDTPPVHSARVSVPDELRRIINRCLRKQPEDRYPDARSLTHDLKVLRRDTETGVSTKTSWRQHLNDTWYRVRHLPPSHYFWYALGVTGLTLALYFSLAKVSLGGGLFLVLVGLWLYRYVRNRPQQAQRQFVQYVSRIPEVRLIGIQDRQITVVVDRPVAQLYGRINSYLVKCNRKIFHGQSMTASIQHDVSAEKTRKFLANSGVQYVREDVVNNI